MCGSSPESGSGRTRDLTTAIFASSKRKSKNFCRLARALILDSMAETNQT